MQTSLIDFDWAVYRTCFSSGDFLQKVERIEFFIQSILEATECDDYRLFLTGTTNFRYEVYPDYKISRKGKPKPDHYHDIRDHLVKFWNAEVSSNCEADDLVATNSGEGTILVAEDKDILTIPGRHYRIKKSWNDNHFLDVSQEDASLNFWIQVLTGDTSDSVPGVPNPAKAHFKKQPNFTWETANELLVSSPNKRQCVEEIYKQVYGDDWFTTFDRNCKLLFLVREGKSYQDCY